MSNFENRTDKLLEITAAMKELLQVELDTDEMELFEQLQGRLSLLVEESKVLNQMEQSLGKSSLNSFQEILAKGKLANYVVECDENIRVLRHDVERLRGLVMLTSSL